MERRLDNIERTLKLQWWFNVLVAVTVLAVGVVVIAQGSEVALAAEDRSHFPVSDHPYLFYFVISTSPEDHRDSLLAAGKFTFASSSSQEIVERCTPTKISPTLYRYDLRELKWDWRQFWKVLEDYPYRHQYQNSAYSKVKYPPPFVIRFDWLTAQLSDTAVSDSHYRLLYNDSDITRDEVLKFWKTNIDPAVHFAVPEGNSGVSVQKKRWLVSQANAIRTYAWGTLDYLDVSKEKDPLANLDYPLVNRFKTPIHDGEEWIFGMPKYSIGKQREGALQSYLLADAKGNRVEEGPGRLVVSDRSFRGYATITNFGGCVNCHKTGLNTPTTNEALALLKSGGIISSKDKEKGIDVERLTLRNPAAEIAAANVLYNTGCELVTGLAAPECTEAFVATIRNYDAPVTMENAAIELYTTADELKLALAWKQTHADFPARLVALVHGGGIPRVSWEEYYYFAYTALKDWERRTQ